VHALFSAHSRGGGVGIIGLLGIRVRLIHKLIRRKKISRHDPFNWLPDHSPPSEITPGMFFFNQKKNMGKIEYLPALPYILRKRI
jgi:hypothetical protein